MSLNLVRDQGVGGSNPLSPIILYNQQLTLAIRRLAHMCVKRLIADPSIEYLGRQMIINLGKAVPEITR